MSCLRKCFVLAVCLALCSLSSPAQSADEKLATVYIYQGWHSWTLWKKTFPVLVDEKEIAKLDRRIYLVAKLPPGKHRFQTKNRRAGSVELEVEAGKVYYLRMEAERSAIRPHPRLSATGKEQAEADLRQMKPISFQDIKDHSIVVPQYTVDLKSLR